MTTRTSPLTDRQPAYRASVSEVITAFGNDPSQGLSSQEAGRRLQAYGPNALPAESPTPAWVRFLEQFNNPLTVLLLIATLVSFVAWLIERESAVPFETITILAIVLLNAALGFVQEARAEQAIAALQAMAAAMARVLRDGQVQAVPTRDLVPGDLMVLEEGDTIPADGRLVEVIALRVAEATLTGESAPISKQTTALPGESGIADQANMVFSGTAVTAGRGRAVVTATGQGTEIGRIAASLKQAEEEPTPLQRELDRTGRLLGIVVIAIAIVMSATIILLDGVRSLGELVAVLLLGVSLAVAAVPEGLTAITTIVLSLGMQRMAGRHVIVRKLSAVETLGSTTVIASDKTGTLTKNEMTVRTALTAGGRVDFTGIGYSPEGEALCSGQPVLAPGHHFELRRTLAASDLASNATIQQQPDGRWTLQGDPTEGALLVAARKLGVTEAELRARFTRVGEAPFSSERKLMSTAHSDAEREGLVVMTTKGAPDVLLARCVAEQVGEHIRPLTPERRAAVLAGVEQLAGEALRTIGVAYRHIVDQPLERAFDEEAEQELVWLGVVGMIDPPRPEVAASVRLAQRAGISVKMITGDHPKTAAAIARELGIAAPDHPTVTGAELQRLEAQELGQVAPKASVYARVAPEHKLQIVQALKAGGAIVAMTGDGVNDAPALKQADIGVAMGITGTDVSKGASDMILTDDNFASIVAAVEEGRSIFANIQKFLRYLLSSNIGEVLVMFLGVVFASALGLLPEEGSTLVLPLLATQILWINLLTDAAPALALGVDPADRGVMEQPPRDPRSRVLTGAMWADMLFIGLTMAVGTLAVMDWSLPGGLLAGTGTMDDARTLGFTTLVFFQLFNVFNARSLERSAFRRLFSNTWLWLALLSSVVLQVLVVSAPLLQEAFGTVPLSGGEWLVCALAGSSVLWLSEAKKLMLARFRQ